MVVRFSRIWMSSGECQVKFMSLKAWEVTIKGVSALAAIGTVFYGVWTYLDQRGLEIKQKKLEIEAMVRNSKSVFLTKQFELYVEAVAVVSRLATSYDYATRDTDLARFWELYWGELGMVEDQKVEGAMVKFRDILIKVTDKIPSEENKKEMKDSSLNLAHCVSESLEDSWGYEFGDRGCR